MLLFYFQGKAQSLEGIMSFIKINEKFYLPIITDEEVGYGVTIIPEIQVIIDKRSRIRHK